MILPGAVASGEFGRGASRVRDKSTETVALAVAEEREAANVRLEARAEECPSTPVPYLT